MVGPARGLASRSLPLVKEEEKMLRFGNDPDYRRKNCVLISPAV
jgi:hypothetical protein